MIINENLEKKQDLENLMKIMSRISVFSCRARKWDCNRIRPKAVRKRP